MKNSSWFLKEILSMSDSENVEAGSVLNISFRVCPSAKKKINKVVLRIFTECGG